MRNHARIIVFVLAGLIPDVTTAQLMPSAAQLSVTVTTEVQTGQPGFLYRYRLTNDQGSRQEAAQFAIVRGNNNTTKITGTPAEWLFNDDIGGLGVIGWTALSDGLIKPGGTAVGFELRAEGLPTIVDAMIVGFIPFEQLPVFRAGEAPDSVPGAASTENSLKIRVLGPGVPSAEPFEPTAFLRRIINQKDEAVVLGWIARTGIVISLEAKLNAALASLMSGQTNTARNQLTACLNEIKAQDGTHLTSDAVGLLTANIAYLLERL